jgi:YD repeat-containing protein
LKQLVLALLMSAPNAVSSMAASSLSGSEHTDLVGPVRTVATTSKALGVLQTDTFDPAGRLVESVLVLEHRQKTTRYRFTYDREGNLEEERAEDDGGTLLYRKLFARGRNGEGRVTAIVAALQDGDFAHDEFSIYDSHGHLSERIFATEGTTTRTLFDVRGQPLYSGRFSGTELFSELQYRYDDRDRLMELIAFGPTGSRTGRLVNEYDEAGKRIRTTTERSQGGPMETWITTYDLDARGNWIAERTTMKLDAAQNIEPPSIVQERTISYYEPP